MKKLTPWSTDRDSYIAGELDDAKNNIEKGFDYRGNPILTPSRYMDATLKRAKATYSKHGRDR